MSSCNSSGDGESCGGGYAVRTYTLPSGVEVAIRRAADGVAASVANHLDFYAGSAEWDIEDWVKSVEDQKGSMTLLAYVLTEEGEKPVLQPVGMATVERNGSALELRHLVVREAYRRKGIGTFLLEKLREIVDKPLICYARIEKRQVGLCSFLAAMGMTPSSGPDDYITFAEVEEPEPEGKGTAAQYKWL